MIKKLDSIFLSYTEPIQSCLLALREYILQLDKNVVETIKWETPCYCYKNRMFCFLCADIKKNLPYILIVEGRYIDHPCLETGNRVRMKILPIDPNKDLPMDDISFILEEALNLYRSGRIKTK